MTREEAIQILSTRDAHGVLCGYTSGYQEALDMAIEALQTLEAVERIKTEVLPQTDLVRCKDCRHCTEYFDRDGYPYWECAEWDGGTDADGFCHYGERKEPSAEQTEYKLPGHDEVMDALDKLTLKPKKESEEDV